MLFGPNRMHLDGFSQTWMDTEELNLDEIAWMWGNLDGVEPTWLNLDAFDGI